MTFYDLGRNGIFNVIFDEKSYLILKWFIYQNFLYIMCIFVLCLRKFCLFWGHKNIYFSFLLRHLLFSDNYFNKIWIILEIWGEIYQLDGWIFCVLWGGTLTPGVYLFLLLLGLRKGTNNNAFTLFPLIRVSSVTKYFSIIIILECPWNYMNLSKLIMILIALLQFLTT